MIGVMQNQKEKHPILLAAGGTGGHVFPAEALAEELAARGERVLLITDKRFTQYISGENIFEIRTIAAGRLQGSLIGKLRAVLLMGLGTLQATWIMMKLRPKVVVGFGGYPSFPSMVAAIILRIPTVIHEQNAVLGRANRRLIDHVKVIATSFAHTLMITDKNRNKVVWTGNPVRSSIRALAHLPYPDLNLGGVMSILVMGGSQGASIFSQIVPAAIAALPAALRSRIRIDQQCRAEDMEVVKAAYAQIGVSANLSTFFSDIPLKLASAHLVISRAGASSLAEFAAASRPVILVPLPSAMDNHQYINASAFEEGGGGWLMAQDGFTAASLSTRIETFLGVPAALMEASKKVRALGNIHAAEHLADVVLTNGKKAV